MTRKSFYSLAVLVWVSSIHDGEAGEMLQSISDDTSAVASPSTSPKQQAQNRRIIYRVICAPEDEALPDCEKPMDDVEGGESVVEMLPVPDLPADTDLDELPAAAEFPKTANSKSIKKSVKPKSKKKSANAKKSASKAKSGKAATKKRSSKK